MDWNHKIEDVQKHLVKEKIDGWLLYDFQGINPLARQFLQVNPEQLITRRMFYWIPQQGTPIKILHQIEPHVLKNLPGKIETFLKWEELEALLGKTLLGVRTVAMEYSPRCAIPYVSKVDGGTIDLVRSFGVQVVSSASFLQYYTCRLSEEQKEMQAQAAQFLDGLAHKTWEKISEVLKRGGRINEVEVQRFMVNEMHSAGFVTEGLPICAVNEHSADPHFEPNEESAKEIQKTDFILIDLWCKKDHPQAVYGDITRVAVADHRPTVRQQEIYNLVRAAQKKATDFVIDRYTKHQKIQGFEVDQVCRQVIEEAGYGKYFTHRTGHNIYTKDHGPGANNDGLETLDLRELIPNTCFSIEPGIYLPGEFGVRQEYDVLLGEKGQLEITGGVQDEIVLLI